VGDPQRRRLHEDPRQARRDEQAKREAQPPWTTDELQTFRRATREHRLFAVFLLACLGMHPAEVCGMRWSDVDLDEGTLAIRNTRTIVGGDVVEKTTMSKAGTQVLPLPTPVVTALRAFRKVQAGQRLAAGEGYTSTGRLATSRGAGADPRRVGRTRRRRRAGDAHLRETERGAPAPGVRRARPAARLTTTEK
jgi:integrase